MIDRRTTLTGIAAAALLERGIGALPPSLRRPNPALWHVETPPTARGTATGPNGAVAYRLYGQGGALPVIVLHGGPAAGELYMRPYAGLAADRRVVLYDQSGCGASAKPADLSRYTLARYVAELEAVRATLGFEKVALLGQSWGGFLAPAYAAAYPHRVGALILAGSAPRWHDFQLAAQRWLAEEGPAAIAIARSGKAGEAAYDALTERYYQKHLCRLNPWPKFLVAAGEALSRNPVYAYLNGPSEFQFTGAFAVIDMRPALRGIRVPTLVTCGQYDEAPAWVGAEITAIVPNSRLLAFPGLSHTAHIEDPARVVGATAAFLRAHT